MAAYGIDLSPDDNGTFLVTASAFTEVTSFGETPAEAVRRGAMAIEEAIGARVKAGLDIPPPDGGARRAHTAHTPLLTDLKVDLYRAAREAKISRAELARRLGWNRTSVDRLFDIDHVSRVDQIEAAMNALGFRIDARPVRVGAMA